VAGALGRELDEVTVTGRKGIVGPLDKKEIALLSVHAGDILGEHTLIFGGIGERLEFIHRAHSRDTFAHGALRAGPSGLPNESPGFTACRMCWDWTEAHLV
jgi:4-hydroxy-tetrahydrodipicolinate reductase